MTSTKSSISSRPNSITYYLLIVVAALNVVVLLTGCNPGRSLLSAPTATPSPTATSPAGPLVLYDWPGDIPSAVLDAFSQEYGIEVTYLTYQSQEEALENMKAGHTYDVVVMENQYVPALIAEGHLTEIDLGHVPNFEYIATNFKDLAYDPGNRYPIPFNWGTTALVIRHDLTQESVTRWADLWNPAYVGKVAIRATPREIIGLTLKSLGFSINSEDPVELDAAQERLLQLRPAILFVDSSAEEAIPLLQSGEVVILVGWAEDILSAQIDNLDVSYVLPEEGPLMWGDSFIIMGNSRQRNTAELFLDFLLRPEINAQIANENFYATPNQAAWPFIKPEILNNPAVFPATSELEGAEVMLPLSPAGEARYTEIWEHFLAAP